MTNDIADFIEQPEPGSRIWRYMDFTKFVSLLETRQLFLSRADKLNDPFEGSVPTPSAEALETIARRSGADPETARFMSHLRRDLRKWMYVNCWHMNDHESAAMWKLYAQTSEAVAIESTSDLLQAAVATDPSSSTRVLVGKVRYVDYNQVQEVVNNLYWPFIHKRMSFAHERELRALTLDPQLPMAPLKDGGGADLRCENPKMGFPISIDPANLILRICVAPTSPGWFFSLVKTVCVRYRLNVDVHQSALDKTPTY